MKSLMGNKQDVSGKDTGKHDHHLPSISILVVISNQQLACDILRNFKFLLLKSENQLKSEGSLDIILIRETRRLQTVLKY